MAQVTYSRKDLVAFANYVLTNKKEDQTEVTHADFENWLFEERVVEIAKADDNALSK